MILKGERDKNALLKFCLGLFFFAAYCLRYRDVGGAVEDVLAV